MIGSAMGVYVTLRAEFHSIANPGGGWYKRYMMEPPEHILHCCACSRYVKFADNLGDGDTVECPFCHAKNLVRVQAVFVGEAVEQA
jgi:hypothetical protein